MDEKAALDANREFLKLLRDEGIKTQGERASYITRKLTFVMVLLGLSSVKIADAGLHWLLYLVPLVAIGYDLYIRAADSSLKKMGAFLRADAQSGAGPSEKAWEQSCARHRDGNAPTANALFSFIVSAAAAIRIAACDYALWAGGARLRLAGFILWLLVCGSAIVLLERRHRKLIAALDASAGGSPTGT
jgi:hypothetical protein